MSSPTRSALLSDLFFNPIGSTGVLATQVPNDIMVLLAMRHRSAQSILEYPAPFVHVSKAPEELRSAAPMVAALALELDDGRRRDRAR